ncbi:chemotaxis protein CheW [Nitrospira sp. Kam-Ns4a]
MNRPAPALDWQEAQARLERVRRALVSGDARSPEEVARILRARARALAKPREPAAPTEETLVLLVFSLAGEQFAIDVEPVRAVVSVRELIPVPCTPAAVLGLLPYRGRILVVVDLCRILDLSGARETAPRFCVWVEAGPLTFGIAADHVEGIRAVPARAVTAAAGFASRRQAATRGVTEDFITVLDLDALARSPEILVNDEGGSQREAYP